MQSYSVRKTFNFDVALTEKVSSILRMFGLTLDGLAEKSVVHKCKIDIEDGDIVYITGPSGAGKSVLMRELERCVPIDERINLDDIELATDIAAVDCFEGSCISSMRFLTRAGLGDVFCMLNTPANFSEGQKWRYRLAKALESGRRFIFADEFCSNLDDVTAAVVSYQMRRYADETGTTFILAGANRSMLADLVPEVIVNKELAGAAKVIYRDLNRSSGHCEV